MPPDRFLLRRLPRMARAERVDRNIPQLRLVKPTRCMTERSTCRWERSSPLPCWALCWSAAQRPRRGTGCHGDPDGRLAAFVLPSPAPSRHLTPTACGSQTHIWPPQAGPEGRDPTPLVSAHGEGDSALLVGKPPSSEVKVHGHSSPKGTTHHAPEGSALHPLLQPQLSEHVTQVKKSGRPRHTAARHAASLPQEPGRTNAQVSRDQAAYTREVADEVARQVAVCLGAARTCDPLTALRQVVQAEKNFVTSRTPSSSRPGTGHEIRL